MDLHLDENLGIDYHSNTQKARVITEGWTKDNLYCPICGEPHLTQFEANRPVADFYCEKCGAEFEQKSIEKYPSRLPKKINGSAYSAMTRRLASDNNPHLLLLYHKDEKVNNLILVPKHFFTTSVVTERNPTWPKGRSTPWIGSYILLENIPDSGIIYLVKNGVEEDPSKVLALYRRTRPLISTDLDKRGWILDVLKCVETIPADTFTLHDVYAFADDLIKKHPGNNHINDKIRQQLQILRDKGFIEFVARGKYKKSL